MKVRFEGIGEDQLLADLADDCADEIVPRVPDSSKVALVIAGDFEDAIRERLEQLGEREEPEAYTAERTHGEAVGKTMKLGDGSVDIVVNGELMTPVGATAAGIKRRMFVRLAAHEAYHVAVYQRGDADAHAIRSRHGLSGMTSRGIFSELAGHAIDEYRVERALCEEGIGVEPQFRRGTSDGLFAFRQRILEGITMRYPDEPMWRCTQTVLTAFHHVTLMLANLAAEELAGGPTAQSVGGPLWDRLVGSNFAEFRDALDVISPATEALGAKELDPMVFAAGEVLDEWLVHIGFSVEDRAEGLYVDVLSHDFDS